MQFTESEWSSMVDTASSVYQLDSTTISIVRSCSLFKLAAAIPYLAESTDRRRESLSNLLLVIAMSLPFPTKDLFAHCITDDDDPLNRLSVFLRSSSGRMDIQKRAVALLSLVMLNDYRTDYESDWKAGKYNPLVEKKWKYETVRDELIKCIGSVDCPVMDEIFSLEEALGRSYWWVG